MAETDLACHRADCPGCKCARCAAGVVANALCRGADGGWEEFGEHCAEDTEVAVAEEAHEGADDQEREFALGTPAVDRDDRRSAEDIEEERGFTPEFV